MRNDRLGGCARYFSYPRSVGLTLLGGFGLSLLGIAEGVLVSRDHDTGTGGGVLLCGAGVLMFLIMLRGTFQLPTICVSDHGISTVVIGLHSRTATWTDVLGVEEAFQRRKVGYGTEAYPVYRIRVRGSQGWARCRDPIPYFDQYIQDYPVLLDILEEKANSYQFPFRRPSVLRRAPTFEL